MSKDRDKKVTRVREAKLEAEVAKLSSAAERSELFVDSLIEQVNLLSIECDTLKARLALYEPPTVGAIDIDDTPEAA